jgi:hypothetical protein
MSRPCSTSGIAAAWIGLGVTKPACCTLLSMSLIAGMGYDIGYIQYAYPNDSKASNFGEAYVGLSYDFEVLEVMSSSSQ